MRFTIPLVFALMISLGGLPTTAEQTPQTRQSVAETTEAHGGARQCPGSCQKRSNADGCVACGDHKTEDAKTNVTAPVDDTVETEAESVNSDRDERGGGRAGSPPQHAQTIHALLTDHAKITRSVTDIPGGIESVTTSDDPEIAALIQQHLEEVRQRLESGMPMRRWDPLFAEIFKHYDKIELVTTKIDGGVRVRETSDDPMVVMLIRQHAHKGVSEFVRDGFARAQQPSPLPEDYVATENGDTSEASHGLGMGMGRGQGPGMGRGPGAGRGMGWGRQRHQQTDPPTPIETDEPAPEPDSTH